jgi:hypothetical protein
MISISYESGESNETCVYKIHLENSFICKFDHHNPDGLAECLHRAADAVELSDWAEAVMKTDAKGG